MPSKNKGKVFFVDINNYKDVAKSIRNSEYQMVSLNENCTEEEFQIIKEEINRALDEILPVKSSFEV